MDAVGKMTAVEPSEGMRNIFTGSITDERVSCQNGSFENTGVSDQSADLVVVAQVTDHYPSNRVKSIHPVSGLSLVSGL